MLKQVYIIHGWDGHPQDNWFPWLKTELENRNFIVSIPQLPKPEEPRIKNCIPALKHIIQNPNEQTYFIGHSMGCQAITRYLETLPEDIVIGGAIFVAGFFRELSNLEDDEVMHDVAREWLTTPLDLKKVKTHIKKSVAIFSDNDPYVPLINQEIFRAILGSEIIIQENKGHFSKKDQIFELPLVRDILLNM